MHTLQIKLSFSGSNWVAYTEEPQVRAAFEAESPQAAVGGFIMHYGAQIGIDLIFSDYGNGVSAAMIELEKTRKQLKAAKEELGILRSR